MILRSIILLSDRRTLLPCDKETHALRLLRLAGLNLHFCSVADGRCLYALSPLRAKSESDCVSNRSSGLTLRELCAHKLHAGHSTRDVRRSIAFVSALKMLPHVVRKTCGRNQNYALAKLPKIEETRRHVLRGDWSAEDFLIIFVPPQTDGNLKRDNILGDRIAAQ